MLYLALPNMHRCATDVDLATGTLARWLAQGDCHATQAAGRDPILRERFRFDAAQTPVAALTREYDKHDAGTHLWLRADPAYVRADMAAARMLACGELGLAQDEADALGSSLQPLFDEVGFDLETTTPSRWYLRCAANEALPEFGVPDLVLGDDLYLHMPSGDVGKRWRRLLSEVQISLHNHPLNLTRSARGQVPINSVWFWGAGVLPETISADLNLLVSDDDLALALAARAQVPARALPRSFDEISDVLQRDQSALLDLSESRDGAALERGWLTPLAAALKNRSVAAVQLLFTSGERHTMRSTHHLRFWRRVRPLRTLSEAEEIASIMGANDASD